ncbi:MAG: tetratricopeptide repeat protein [Terriglobales bacterium]
MSRNRNRTNNVPAGYWSAPQAYIFASITLLIGLAAGYLLRGTGASNTHLQSNPVSATAPSPGSGGQSPDLTAARLQPMLQQLQSRPNDPALLADIGNTYYDAHQYQQAIDYYQRALKFRPADVNIRTDMGTAMWYSGDPDGALKQYEQSLKYQPTHGQTLFNMGIVKWQGKGDGKGALQVWQRLLETNPNYPDRPRLEELMQQVRAGK